MTEAFTAEEKRIYRAVAKQAESLSDEALACRAGSHSFTKPLHAEVTRRGGWTELYECVNGCGCRRSRECDRWGMVLKSQIHYPPKDQPYLLHGTGRLTGFQKGALRVANVERVIVRLEGRDKRKGAKRSA